VGEKPAVVAVDMGYGHLRAAEPLAEILDAPLLELDRPPLADEEERRLWAKARAFHETTSRLSQLPVAGAPFRELLDAVTQIPPLHPRRDLSEPNAGTRYLDRMSRRGLGSGLVRYLEENDVPLLTTFYAPAVLADRLGRERVFCVVTDTDINRVWAPIDKEKSRATYLAPSLRAVARLEAYGVRREKIVFTGFPLPHELLGGLDLPAARSNLAARLVRLDPKGIFLGAMSREIEQRLGPLPRSPGGPPLLTFAIGGAGAQVELADRFLPSLRPLLESEQLKVALVAGRRAEVAEKLHAYVECHEIARGVEILVGPDWRSYYKAFNALLARTDVLWTKPSEMTFYAALGLPLVISDPVGVHEKYNRRWAMEAGAGLVQRDVRFTADWLEEWLSEGTLAAAAWSGFVRLPNQGLYRIIEAVTAR
jgi:UDP-N-acetylglucosamine:LPS N-acetylglucosamine transferase